MQDFLTAKRSEIAELCRLHNVRRLAVFGSAVRDDFDPLHSDIDLLVEFNPAVPATFTKNYLALEQGMAQLFDRPVDLVTYNSVRNPYLLRRIDQQQEQLYAA